MAIRDEFWSHVIRTEGCWLWQRSRTKAGYGNFRGEDGKNQYAHIHAYRQLVGEIPEGMRLDHSCFTEHCVNPAHLSPVTQKKNGERRRGAPANSSSGVRGVSWMPRLKRWRAYATHHDKQYSFGTHATLEEAERAVVEGRMRLYEQEEPRPQRPVSGG